MDIQDLHISYEDMLKSGMHFGRKKTVFNPKMEPYVYMVRDGICIIDLLKTQTQLTNTVKFLKKTVEGDAGGIMIRKHLVTAPNLFRARIGDL